LLWQQHFNAQPVLANTPVANKLAPKVKAIAMQMALISNLFPEAPLFIVKQYTLNGFAMSIGIDQKFVTG
jgi:hypothetical protein